jgi:hypothetical protein
VRVSRYDPPMASARSYEFDTATRIKQVGGHWQGSIAEGWDMGGTPNGGYQLAIASRAILAATDQPDVISLLATFLGRAHPGPVTIAIAVVPSRSRRHVATVTTVSQDDLPTTVIQALTGHLPASAGQRMWEASPPPLDPAETYPRLLPVDPAAPLPPPFVRHVDLHIPHEYTGFTAGKAHGTPSIIGWVKFPDDRPIDTMALPVFADAFPPAVFNTGGALGWVPTLTLSIQIRRRPKGPWLAASFRSRFVDDTYLDEDGELWDTDGTLVALSRQLALAPRG